MEGTLLHHSAPMQHVKFRVPTILTTPEIGGVPHHALERCIQLVILPSQNGALTKTGGPVVKIFAYGSQRNIYPAA